MSGLWDRPQTNPKVATTFENESQRRQGGQEHDRILDDTDHVMAQSMPLPGNENEYGITVGQKMLSAMSGSLVTSLLGMHSLLVHYIQANHSITVTPLDVVRVRLQSQPVQPLRLTGYSLQPFDAIPKNLGVTVCCREVFFANSAVDYCMALPKEASALAGSECGYEQTQKRSFNSTFDGLRKIARNEGATTLWRGLSPTLAMTVPANIIYFTGYDYIRFNDRSPISRFSDNSAPLISGGAARVFAAAAVSPIEMLRTRMQASTSTQGSHFADAVKGIGEMVSTRGYTSLWRGLTLTLWRDVPFSGIYWWGYENIRGLLTEARGTSRGRSLEVDGRSRPRTRSPSRENSTLTFTDSFIAGASSGAAASILTMPFDVGKTRRQIFKDAVPSAGAEKILAPEERSMARFLWHIFREEGASGLWRGWIPRTLKVAPACAIMISSYEMGKRAFRSMNEADRVRPDV